MFVLAWSFTGAAVVGALDRYLWIGALVRELGFHLAWTAMLGAAFALARRAWLPAASLSGLALLFAVPLAPLYRPTRPTPEAGPLLRVATAHLSGAEFGENALRSWLARTRPDAVALSGLKQMRNFGESFDVTPRGRASAPVGSYRVVRGRADLHLLLLVKSALAVPARENNAERASATLRIGRCALRVVAVELPTLAAYTARDARKRAIAELAKLPRAARSVWLGQLGSRPEAHDLTPLTQPHELRDGRHGHGRFATAPGSLAWFGFPLSHLLVHGWLRVRDLAADRPFAPGAQRTLHATVELTEPPCRFARDTRHE